MRLAVLTNDIEKRFFDYVTADYCDYYFFIYDWLRQKEKTKVYLALEQEQILGLMLIYDGSIVQLRGKQEVVRFLLSNLEIESAIVQAPRECEKIVTEKFPTFTLKENITLMSINKGEEQPSVSVQPEALNAKDAEEIALLLNVCYPEMWGDMTAEAVRSLFRAKENFWLGIKQQGKLVSFGYATLTSKVSHVTWIATHPQWQNKGYAKSIVSALVEKCLSKAPTAIIYVMDNNLVAKSIYLKVGFKPYKQYFVLKP